MKQRFLAGLAVAGALSLGIAACGSSSNNGSGNTGSVKMGKTLVVESTPLSPMTDTFNPFSLTSTGYLTNAISLYNEPLFIFNTLNSAQAPIPMLATGYSWSNSGKTLTLTIRSGVKWNDGKPFSASDVAYTFNLLKSNPKLYTSGAPIVTSASAPSATSAVLNFATPQYANLFLIGQVYIVPQHVWSSVSDPATYSDASPVGTGPFMLDKFSPQGYTLKPNPHYWQKSKVHVPEVRLPGVQHQRQPGATRVQRPDRLRRQLRGQHPEQLPGQERGEPHLAVQRAVLQCQQRGQPVPEHH